MMEPKCDNCEWKKVSPHNNPCLDCGLRKNLTNNFKPKNTPFQNWFEAAEIPNEYKLISIDTWNAALEAAKSEVYKDRDRWKTAITSLEEKL